MPVTILHILIYEILSKSLELTVLLLFPFYRCTDSKWFAPGQDLYSGSLILEQQSSLEIECKPLI